MTLVMISIKFEDAAAMLEESFKLVCCHRVAEASMCVLKPEMALRRFVHSLHVIPPILVMCTRTHH